VKKNYDDVGPITVTMTVLVKELKFWFDTVVSIQVLFGVDPQNIRKDSKVNFF